MTSDEVFNRQIANLGLGRPLELTADSPAGRGYEQLRRRSEQLIADARKNVDGLPEISLGFIDNPAVNAFAFRSEDHYFIGVTTGTVFVLELLMMRMLSDARLFDHVGHPEEEASDLSPLSNFVPNAKEMSEIGYTAIAPRTGQRHFYAGYLLDHAMLFLVGHEIAHITLGHIDCLQSKIGAPAIAELGQNARGEGDVIERQCIETQADIRSVFSRLASLQLTHKAHGPMVPPWSESPLTEALLIFDWAFAMNSLFRVFGDVRFDSLKLLTESYPPLSLRRAIASVTAYGAVMEHWDSSLKESILLSLRTAVKYTERAFATILGESLKTEGLADAFGVLGRDHHRLLANQFERLDHRLAPFAFEHVLYTYQQAKV